MRQWLGRFLRHKKSDNILCRLMISSVHSAQLGYYISLHLKKPRRLSMHKTFTNVIARTLAMELCFVQSGLFFSRNQTNFSLQTPLKKLHDFFGSNPFCLTCIYSNQKKAEAQKPISMIAIRLISC